MYDHATVVFNFVSATFFLSLSINQIKVINMGDIRSHNNELIDEMMSIQYCTQFD